MRKLYLQTVFIMVLSNLLTACGGGSDAGIVSIETSNVEDAALVNGGAHEAVHIANGDTEEMDVAENNEVGAIAETADIDDLIEIFDVTDDVGISGVSGVDDVDVTEANVGGASEVSNTPVSSAPSKSIKEIDSSLAEFETTLHALITGMTEDSARCSLCHTGNIPGATAFAIVDGPDVSLTTIINQNLVSTSNPMLSRIYLKVKEQKHNCWNDCDQDAAVILNAINRWVDSITEVEPEPKQRLETPSVTFRSSLERVEKVEREGFKKDRIAHYDFSEGAGDSANNSSASGIESYDLMFDGEVTWLGGKGISFDNGVAYADEALSEHIYSSIFAPQTGSHAFSIELWLSPDLEEEQVPLNIIAFTDRESGENNFRITQEGSDYHFQNRMFGSNEFGDVALRTSRANPMAQGEFEGVQHVVMTFDKRSGRKIYIDGAFTGDVEPLFMNEYALEQWQREFQLSIGGAGMGGPGTDDEPKWRGSLYQVSIYDQALTAEQVNSNFKEGLVEQSIRFDLSTLTDTAGSYLEMTVREFAQDSYELGKPVVYNPSSASFGIQGIHVMVNGEQPVSGQIYTEIDHEAVPGKSTISAASMVVSKVLGEEEDRFTLSFRSIGSESSPVQEVEPVVIKQLMPTASTQENLGLKLFNAINSSYSTVTAVPPEHSEVNTLYRDIMSGLPARSNPSSLNAALLTNIETLAGKYCEVASESTEFRAQLYGNHVFEQSPNSFFDLDRRASIVETLYTRALNTKQNSSVSLDIFSSYINSTWDAMLAQCNSERSCNAEFTLQMLSTSCSMYLTLPDLLFQ